MKHSFGIPLLALAASLLLPGVSQARVKLVLLPQRENLRLHFEPTRVAVPLMEEERVVALEAGFNEVELAWTGLPIQPGSVIFTPLTSPETLTTLSIAVPPSEQQALVWRVKSEKAQNARLRISYVLTDEGMYERTDYKAIANAEETQVSLTGTGRVRNNTGLTQPEVSLELADAAPVKLSLDRDERRELSVQDAVGYPLTKTYTSDSGLQGGKVFLRYEWVVPAKGRAQTVGKARAFLAAGEKEAMDTFLGEDFLGYVPAGERCKLLVGLANDLEVERKVLASESLNERFTKNTTPIQLVMHDQREKHKMTVKNHRPKPLKITLVEHHGGDWEVTESSVKPERKDAQTFEFAVEAPADGQVEVTYTIVEKYIHQ